VRRLINSRRKIHIQHIRRPLLDFDEELIDTVSSTRYTGNGPVSPPAYLDSTKRLYLEDRSVITGTPYYYRVRAIYSPSGSASDVTDWVLATPRGTSAGITIYDTLKYEGGTPAGGARWAPGNRFAVHFTSPCATRIDALLYHFDIGGGFRPAIYNWDGEKPSGEMFLWFSAATASSGWNSYSVSSTGLVADGDFVVSANLLDGVSALSWAYPTIPGKSWDYRSGSSIWTAVSDSAYFIRVVLKYQTDRWYVNLTRGWNMFSIPVIPANPTPLSCLPTAIIGSIFYYNPETRAYVPVAMTDTLKAGVGYWMASDRDTFYTVTGNPVSSRDIAVKRGWNMIGTPAIYPGVRVSEATYFPSSSILGVSNSWFYNSRTTSYDTQPVLSPGKAYWMVFSSDGVIRLSE
jgi:hypothetical protein